MADYRVYVVGPDGHIVDATVLRCADDQAALRSAERLLRKDTLELNIPFCDSISHRAESIGTMSIRTMLTTTVLILSLVPE